MCPQRKAAAMERDVRTRCGVEAKLRSTDTSHDEIQE